MLNKIYSSLMELYGPQGWWPLYEIHLKGGSNPTKTGSIHGYHPGDYSYPKTDLQRFEICIGSILTQNTTWVNVEKAIVNLNKNGIMDPLKIKNCDDEILKSSIKPAGYFNQKAKKIRIFSGFYKEKKGSTPSREDLLALWGIGPQTADSILLYAYNVPEFIVDTYTKRILENIGLVNESAGYEEIKELFHTSIKKDPVVYQEYHALLVEHAKRYYLKNADFSMCPLLDLKV